jgi:hypothetical protein
MRVDIERRMDTAVNDQGYSAAVWLQVFPDFLIRLSCKVPDGETPQVRAERPCTRERHAQPRGQIPPLGKAAEWNRLAACAPPEHSDSCSFVLVAPPARECLRSRLAKEGELVVKVR